MAYEIADWQREFLNMPTITWGTDKGVLRLNKIAAAKAQEQGWTYVQVLIDYENHKLAVRKAYPGELGKRLTPNGKKCRTFSMSLSAVAICETLSELGFPEGRWFLRWNSELELLETDLNKDRVTAQRAAFKAPCRPWSSTVNG